MNSAQEGQRSDNFRLIQEVVEAVAEDNNLAWGAQPQKTKFYKISGFVQRVLTDDKMSYNACPDCRKKVQEEPAGYRCENCNKVHMTMNPTYMLMAKIADLSGSIYIQFTRELGDAIMNGMSARQFLELKESFGSDQEAGIRNFLADNVLNKVSSKV